MPKLKVKVTVWVKGQNKSATAQKSTKANVCERSGKNLFWSIKNSCEVLNKLKSRGFRASSLSTYDFSTLYTTLPHNLMEDKLVDLIERIFQKGRLSLYCM